MAEKWAAWLVAHSAGWWDSVILDLLAVLMAVRKAVPMVAAMAATKVLR